jgi:hypothetical protein
MLLSDPYITGLAVQYSLHAMLLKAPKCDIFDLFDFNDFYVIKSLEVGDLRAEIKN